MSSKWECQFDINKKLNTEIVLKTEKILSDRIDNVITVLFYCDEVEAIFDKREDAFLYMNRLAVKNSIKYYYDILFFSEKDEESWNFLEFVADGIERNYKLISINHIEDPDKVKEYLEQKLPIPKIYKKLEDKIIYEMDKIRRSSQDNIDKYKEKILLLERNPILEELNENIIQEIIHNWDKEYALK